MRDNEQNIIGATGSLLPASCVTLITEFLVFFLSNFFTGLHGFSFYQSIQD